MLDLLSVILICGTLLFLGFQLIQYLRGEFVSPSTCLNIFLLFLSQIDGEVNHEDNLSSLFGISKMNENPYICGFFNIIFLIPTVNYVVFLFLFSCIIGKRAITQIEIIRAKNLKKKSEEHNL